MLRLNEGCFFGNNYCKGSVMWRDGSTCSVFIQYKDGYNAGIKSHGVDVKELVGYLVDMASKPRVAESSSKRYLGRMMEEMLNAPLDDPKFTTVERNGIVESVAEEDGLTYTIAFDGSALIYTYRVEDKESGEYVDMLFDAELPLEFDKFIEALNIEEE